MSVDCSFPQTCKLYKRKSIFVEHWNEKSLTIIVGVKMIDRQAQTQVQNKNIFMRFNCIIYKKREMEHFIIQYYNI